MSSCCLEPDVCKNTLFQQLCASHYWVPVEDHLSWNIPEQLLVNECGNFSLQLVLSGSLQIYSKTYILNMASWIITVTEEHIFWVGNFQDFNENFPLNQSQQVKVIPACFHRQVPTGCWCREGKTFPPELTLLFFSKCFPVLPQNLPPTHCGQPLLQGTTAAMLGVWQEGTSFGIYESLRAEMIYCAENFPVCYLSIVNGWEIPGLFMPAAAWEKIMILSLTIKLLIRSFFTPFF